MSSMNVAEFIEKILQTKVNDARLWMESFERGFPASMWEMFMQLPITADSVRSIANGVSLQISRASRKVPKEEGMRIIRDGHLFLKSVHEKAKEFGLKTDLKDIDWIFAPGLEQIGEILHHAG